jgi:hypothetical protein
MDHHARAPSPATPSPSSPLAEFTDDGVITFTPVPMGRRRRSGWTEAQQRRFIIALEAMGSVGRAARACGMGRASAYRLRERAGAESFAAAWDLALECGRSRQFEMLIDRARHGITSIRIVSGSHVSVKQAPDLRIMRTFLRELPAQRARLHSQITEMRGSARDKATKETK